MLSDLKLDKRMIQLNLKEKALTPEELNEHLKSLDNVEEKGIYISDLFQKREEEEAARLAEEEARLAEEAARLAEEEARLAEETTSIEMQDQEAEDAIDYQDDIDEE